MNQGIFLPPLALGTVTAPFSRGEEGSAQGPLQLQMTHAGGAPSSQLQQDEVFPKFFSRARFNTDFYHSELSNCYFHSTAQAGWCSSEAEELQTQADPPQMCQGLPAASRQHAPPSPTAISPRRSQTTPACPEEAARLGAAPGGTSPAHPFGAWSSPGARRSATSAVLPSWDRRCPARGAGAQLRLCSHFASGVSALCLFLPLPQRHRLQVLTDTRWRCPEILLLLPALLQRPLTKRGPSLWISNRAEPKPYRRAVKPSQWVQEEHRATLPTGAIIMLMHRAGSATKRKTHQNCTKQKHRQGR